MTTDAQAQPEYRTGAALLTEPTPGSRVTRVAILNVVASNTGDAAILAGLVDVVRRAFGERTAIDVYDSQPEVAARLYPELRFGRGAPTGLLAMTGNGRLRTVRRHLTRFRLLTAARLRARGKRRVADRLVRPSERGYLERLESYDLLISTGGTYLVEHYEIWGRLLELELVVALNRPLVLFTQSLGPFTVAIHRRQIRAVSRRARLVLVRDQRSRSYLEQAGADPDRVLIRPDAAFVFAEPASVRRTAPHVGRVAVSVRDWTHHRDGAHGMERYLDAIASACEALVSRGNEITFVSTCQGVPEYSADDARCAARVLGRMAGPACAHCRIDDAFHTPVALANILAGFDAFISTRMHGAILALGVGVPVLPIAYEFKTTELFTRLGLERWLTDIDTIEPASFTELVERFFDELPRIADAIWDPVLAEHAAALEVVSDLRRAAA